MRQAPVDILNDWIGEAPIGRALDLGAGDGAVSRWLANLGFEVDAVERDPSAAAQLKQPSQSENISLHETELTAFSYPILTYNFVAALAVLHFLQPTELWDVADRILGSLAPGGILIAEVFTSDDPGRQALLDDGAPELEPNTFLMDDSDGVIHYFEAGELKRVFTELDVLAYDESRRVDAAAKPAFRAGATLVGRKR